MTSIFDQPLEPGESRRARMIRYGMGIVPLPRSRRAEAHMYIGFNFYASFASLEAAEEAKELFKLRWKAIKGKKIRIVESRIPRIN